MTMEDIWKVYCELLGHPVLSSNKTSLGPALIENPVDERPLGPSPIVYDSSARQNPFVPQKLVFSGHW